MSPAKLTLASGLVTLALAGCGIAAKPQAGNAHLLAARGNHAKVDDPRIKHVQCLRTHGLTVHLFSAPGARPAIQVGSAPNGPTVVFEPTPGDAQGLQIVGQAPGAEVIGSALLYPNQASDAELKTVEDCVALGVKG